MKWFRGDQSASIGARPVSFRPRFGVAGWPDWHIRGTLHCANQIRSHKVMMRHALRSDVPSTRSWRVSPKPALFGTQAKARAPALVDAIEYLIRDSGSQLPLSNRIHKCK